VSVVDSLIRCKTQTIDNTETTETTETTKTRMPILTFKKVEKLSPWKQFLFVLIPTTLLMLTATYWSENTEMHWILATTGMGFYLWMNTFIFFFVLEKQLRYFILSVLFFALLIGTTSYLAQYLSGMYLSKLYVYRSLIIAICIFFFVATGITFATKSLKQAFGVEDH